MQRALLCVVLLACGGSRATFARYPGSPAAFDRTACDPKALEIADKVFAAAGGPGNWDKAKQLRWDQTISAGGEVKLEGEEAWDRWNARHWGHLHGNDGEVVVGYELYGTFKMGYGVAGKHHEKLAPESLQTAIGVAKARFDADTALMTLQFLMLEPGVKLKYIGTAADDTGADAADDIQVTFTDPLRQGLEYHAIVDRATSTIARVEMIKAGTMQKIGYSLASWVTVNGMKFATARKDLGSEETVAIKNLKVSEPEDELFVQPFDQ